MIRKIFFFILHVSMLCAASAFENEINESEKNRALRASVLNCSLNFEKYLGIYDRCCGESYDQCKCPVRGVTKFGIKAKWDKKCKTSILEKSSIAALGASDDNFSTLVSLVKEAGLLGTLGTASADGKGYTLFAPTNAAFEKLGNVDLTPAQLKQVLLYHVVAGTVTSDELTDGKVATLNGQKLTVDVSSNGVKLNGSTNVVAADNFASNGVVHVIDAVLLPQL